MRKERERERECVCVCASVCVCVNEKEGGERNLKHGTFTGARAMVHFVMKNTVRK